MLVTIGSITTATRFSRIIERKIGVPSEVMHTPSSIRKGGCSYSVRFDERYYERIRDIVKEYSVPVRRYYSEQMVDGRRVYHALS